MSDRIVQRAVREGYDSMLKDREFPVGYLSISLPSEDVDVNVHPQKSEVRFRHPQQVFAVVHGAVLSAVRRIKQPLGIISQDNSCATSVGLSRTSESVAGVGALALSPHDEPGASVQEPIAAATQYQSQNLFERVHTGATPYTVPLQSRELKEQTVRYAEANSQPLDSSSQAHFRFSDLRFIGQLLECYLVCEQAERLVIVDMHAAHERVNYNKVRAAHAARTVTTQKLLLPETIRLTEEQVVHLVEQKEVLEELGFELIQVSPDSVTVLGVPGILSHLDFRSLLKECAAEPLSAGWRERIEERIDHIAARVACHASVRSGDLLTRQEVYALFAELDQTHVSGACPHGRPVVTYFSRDAVERWFGRDR